jgi:predicted Rossmann-fold nucleotide-binding protein
MAADDEHRLYKFTDLLSGYEREHPIGYTRTYDFQTFRRFIIEGGPAPISPEVQHRQAEHDARITTALREFLKREPRLVGFMGGHKLSRAEPAYAMVARLAQKLTREDFVVVSGGGPGAMEASHLGAAFATVSDGQLDAALEILAQKDTATLPALNDVLDSSGNIKQEAEENVRKAQAWFAQSLKVYEGMPATPGVSLAIPTWLYGNEPTNPFATHYAKYFQNSIREEALVTEARTGIVYARGGGGTLREIFQDVEQNYYAKTAEEVTPMIFCDADRYWEREPEYDSRGVVTKAGIKLDVLIPQIIRFARASRGFKDRIIWEQKLRFTTDFVEIADILTRHAPRAQKNLNFLLSGEASEVALAAFNRTA